jgi:hypothetical protein
MNGKKKLFAPVKPQSSEVSYFICPDGTISHVQPKSRGLNGWEGYCGQTSLSNIASMLCQRHLLPKDNDSYGTDVTPGQNARTMRMAFNRVFSESPKTNTCPKLTWLKGRSWNQQEFLEEIKIQLFQGPVGINRTRKDQTQVKITPIPVLLNSGGLNYHWVTLVDITPNSEDEFGCDMVVNTWGDQRVLTCEHFMDYTDHTGISERDYLKLPH